HLWTLSGSAKACTAFSLPSPSPLRGGEENAPSVSLREPPPPLRGGGSGARMLPRGTGELSAKRTEGAFGPRLVRRRGDLGEHADDVAGGHLARGLAGGQRPGAAVRLGRDVDLLGGGLGAQRADGQLLAGVALERVEVEEAHGVAVRDLVDLRVAQ